MTNKKIAMEHDKKVALVAHDNKKGDLMEWAKFNRDLLAHHKVYATGTTGQILERELGFKILKLQSGPLGGDQQIGAKIADGEIDFLIFFWDPLEPQPHDSDVKALLRMAVVWNIPIACNRASADFMISSPLMDGEYDRLVPDYQGDRTPEDSQSESYRRMNQHGGALMTHLITIPDDFPRAISRTRAEERVISSGMTGGVSHDHWQIESRFIRR